MATEPSGHRSRYRKYVEVVTGSLDEKKRWRRYKARVKELPENYRTALEAMERYLMHFGPMGGPVEMFEDLADLFEQSAAGGTPVRDLFGHDPIEFVEMFMNNYPAGQYRARERDRFISAVARAAGDDAGRDDSTA